MVQADVWETAAKAEVQPRGPWHVFGQVFTDGFYCVLQKGIGKVPFDASQHRIEDRRTSIKIDMLPMARDGVGNEVARDMIAESREWAGVVLPSLKAAGVDPGDLNNRWTHAEMAKTGQSYMSRTTGEKVEKTTFKFLEFYADEAACRAACDAFWADLRAGQNDEDEDLPPDPGGNGQPAGGNDHERTIAAAFLPALFKQASGNPSELAKLIAGNGLTSRYFDLNSPEVIKLFGVN